MQKSFGSIVAGAVATLALSGVAMADGKAPATKGTTATPAAAKVEAGWCKSSCKGHVAGAKNSCNGQQACAGMTKEACEKDGHGAWSTEAKPAAAPAAAPTK
jgi:hypothetical protein